MCPKSVYWRQNWPRLAPDTAPGRFSVKKLSLHFFVKLTKKHQKPSLFLTEVTGLQPGALLKGLCRICFPVNFTKFSEQNKIFPNIKHK